MIIRKIKSSRFFVLYNFHDEKALGRTVMMCSTSLSSIITYLTGSLFYTSFLMANGINLVNIGIMTFIPYIANCFSVFSPSILERFSQRRWILAASRCGYYVLNLLAITLMPLFVKDVTARMVCFVALTLAANILNALFVGGYSVWHINFIPNDIRAEYFANSSMISSFISCGAALASGVIADALSASPYQTTIFTLFRYIAFALGLLDTFLLTRPVEYPYAKTTDKPRLTDIIVKPLSHKKFRLTMLIVFLWGFFISVPSGSLDYYLLNDVGVQYTFIYLINMCYPFFLLVFTPYWRRKLDKWGWFKTFAFAAMGHVPTTLLYSCVTSSTYIWALPLLRLIQHFLGVGMNTAYSNMAYINLPKTDQTNYISFHTMTSNISTFLGILAGTAFINFFPDISLGIGRLNFGNVQILIWVQAFGQFFVPALVLKLLSKLQPAPDDM